MTWEKEEEGPHLESESGGRSPQQETEVALLKSESGTCVAANSALAAPCKSAGRRTAGRAGLARLVGGETGRSGPPVARADLGAPLPRQQHHWPVRRT